ncbi:hypothetical protein [Peribacillus frigoritolerans]|uniref:Fur-regulated basic protein B n=1 Tax=Peribacillus castrilensis TaxID=2897690 RepID=A0AAW9NAF0_9BACI|nr:hypothetical protein [Peribacillus castrilensis]
MERRLVDFKKEMIIQQLRFEERMLKLTLKENDIDRAIASMRTELNKG